MAYASNPDSLLQRTIAYVFNSVLLILAGIVAAAVAGVIGLVIAVVIGLVIAGPIGGPLLAGYLYALGLFGAIAGIRSVAVAREEALISEMWAFAIENFSDDEFEKTDADSADSAPANDEMSDADLERTAQRLRRGLALFGILQLYCGLLFGIAAVLVSVGITRGSGGVGILAATIVIALEFEAAEHIGNGIVGALVDALIAVLTDSPVRISRTPITGVTGR
jgi:hypothetical protein